MSVLFDVLVADGRTGLLLASALEGTGLQPTEYGIYSVIVEGGPITPGELAHRLGMRASTLSGYLAAMARHGHLRRFPNPQDRRSVLLELTASGRDIQRRAASSVLPATAALEAELDVPTDEIRRTLRALAEALDRVLRRTSPGA